MLFLQQASDPITFFSFESAWREPEWMRAPRGPDVSPDLRWFPVVTMLQLAADMALGSAPRTDVAPRRSLHKTAFARTAPVTAVLDAPLAGLTTWRSAVSRNQGVAARL